MRISTALIFAVGVTLIIFEVAMIAWERLAYPYRIDDIGLPWTLMIIGGAGVILAVGLAKLAFGRLLAKRRRISN